MGRRRAGISGVKVRCYLLAVGLIALGLLLPGDMEADSELREALRAEHTDGVPAETADDAADTDGEAQDKGKGTDGESTEEQSLSYDGTIRVLLRTSDYAGELHGTVELASASGQDLSVYDGTREEILDSGNTLVFTREEDTLFLNGEPLAGIPEYLSVRAAKEDRAGIAVPSVTRSSGTPVYEGTLEIWPADGGFYLVNEVDFETYLKYVTPSEMPAGYEPEALKAQAVCARTYACRQLFSWAYPDCRAHVDDSVSYQVYNNTGTAESTSRAVVETSGQILTWQGAPVTAYYFSTSCGATGNEEIWWEGDAALTPYLSAKTTDAEGGAVDLSSEEAFAAFLSEENENCYDAGISWYRWETLIDNDTLTENLNAALQNRYRANPEAILTRQGGEYVSREITDIGRIQGIDVLDRNEGGAVVRLLVRGSRETILVQTEYNVRALLNPRGCAVERRDKTSVAGTSLLPSACVLISPVFDEKGELYGWQLQGGGFGHGVGLSQNGANAMAAQGMGFVEILAFYYTGAELTALTDV